MTGTMRALGVAGAMAALLLSAACGGGGKPKPEATTGKLVTTGVMLLKKYDAGSASLRYQGTKKVREPDEAILPAGPLQNATVAKDAQVLSAVDICSGDDATVDQKTGIGTKSCTLEQLDAALRDGAQIDAYLTMRGGNVIKIAEVYHP
ncbi:MAG: hypothetical protein JWR24_4393 [Actinoallomurus sp.]|jgi:hypothetical protein|nr:hypothetical protein [Actinoallomurus sp.]